MIIIAVRSLPKLIALQCVIPHPGQMSVQEKVGV